MFRRIVVSIALPSGLFAQSRQNRYASFQEALGLSDEQLAKCIEDAPASAGAADQKVNSDKATRLLTDLQRRRLQSVADRALRAAPGEASLADLLDLNSGVEWQLCVCACSSLSEAAEPLRFRSQQMDLLAELRYAAAQHIREDLLQKQGRRDVLVSLGYPADAIARQNAEIGRLLTQLHKPKVRADLAMLILNEKQKAIAEEIGRNFSLARDAIELGLLPRHMGGADVLCN